MVLDWESARYTKPDKPLNAYDTLYKYYPEMKEKIRDVMKFSGPRMLLYNPVLAMKHMISQ